MAFLRGIAARIKGNDCERSVKRLATDFSLSGSGIDAGGVATINVGLFSRKVVELVKATETAASLDDMQYQLCKTIHSTRDEALRTICERIRLQIMVSFNQFTQLIEAVKTDASPEIRKKLVEWMDFSSDLSKYAIDALDPGSTARGVRPQYSLQEIAKYQKITEDDMREALDLMQ